jgi:hypothetical protein
MSKHSIKELTEDDRERKLWLKAIRKEQRRIRYNERRRKRRLWDKVERTVEFKMEISPFASILLELSRDSSNN